MSFAILNYKISFLSTLLKMITPLVFLLAAYFFIKARKEYGGAFKNISTLLLIAAITGVIAHSFRYIGGIAPSQWKWGESIFFLIFASINLYISIHIARKLIKIAEGN